MLQISEVADQEAKLHRLDINPVSTTGRSSPLGATVYSGGVNFSLARNRRGMDQYGPSRLALPCDKTVSVTPTSGSRDRQAVQ
jgi:hypothetical protein